MQNSQILVWAASDSKEAPAGQGRSKVNKRQRQVLACEPCHRHKIKCDRGRPCNRCISGNRIEKCTYQPLLTSKNMAPAVEEKADEGLKRPSPIVAQYVNGKAYYSTATRWAGLIWEFHEGYEFFFGTNEDFKSTYKDIKELRILFPSRTNKNFPFSSLGATKMTISQLLNCLPPRETVDFLINNYFITFEPILPLWHYPSFQEELSAFWNSPENTKASWLAQVFMMLTLSCCSATNGHQFFGLTEGFLNAAEAALGGTHLVAILDLATLRTLCMILIAKKMDIVTLNDSTSLPVLMGFLVRSAMSISLQRDPKWFKVMPPAEAITRKRIWTTILFLDLIISTESSLPTLIRTIDYDTRLTTPTSVGASNDNESQQATTNFNHSPVSMGTPLSNISETLNGNTGEEGHYQVNAADSKFQIILTKVIPVASLIVNTLNSVNPEIPYTKVAEYDHILRKLLHDASQLSSLSPLSPSSGISQTSTIQETFLEIFLRRCLLTLHQPYARDPERWRNYQNSHWTVLECSLALLNCRERLADSFPTQPLNSPLPSTSSTYYHWFIDLFRSDFGIATIYIALGLRRNDFAATTTAALSMAEIDGAERSAKDIAWLALRHTVKGMAHLSGRSFGHFKSYMGISFLIAALESLESGEPMLNTFEKAAEEIIRTVREGRQRCIEEQQSHMHFQDNGTASGDPMATDHSWEEQQKIDPVLGGSGMGPDDWWLYDDVLCDDIGANFAS